MDRIIEIARKEFIQTFRDPRMAVMVFVVPVLELFLFGYAVTTEVKNLDVAVMDRDGTRESRQLLSAVLSSGYFRRAADPADDAALADALVLSRVDLALVVPAGFADRLSRGEQARIQMIIDGSESNSGTIGLGYLGKALGGYSLDSASASLPAIARRTGGRLRSLPMIVAQTRYRFNPELKSSFFFVPGVIGMTTMIMTSLMTNMALTREREVGTIEQLVVTPLKSHELMLGKILPFTLIGLIDITLILPVATGHFGLPLRGSIPLIYLGALLFFLSTLGLALIISTLARTQQQAVFVTFLFIFPLVLLSGLMFPIANMPEPIQWLTALNPLRYFLVVLRGVIIKGNGFMTLAPEFAKMLALGLGLFTVAVLRFKRNID